MMDITSRSSEKYYIRFAALEAVDAAYYCMLGGEVCQGVDLAGVGC